MTTIESPYRVVLFTQGGTVITPASSQREAEATLARQQQEYAGRLSGLPSHTEYRYEGAWHSGRFWWGRH